MALLSRRKHIVSNVGKTRALHVFLFKKVLSETAFQFGAQYSTLYGFRLSCGFQQADAAT